MMETITLIVVILAFGFDFVNGFHDAANAIATIVATKVLTPLQAVGMSAAGNFVGMLFGTVVGVLIAKTIGKGIIDTELVSGMDGVYLILAVLVGAIAWDLITWWLGLPTSSSHALVGGLVGAGLAAAGPAAIIMPDLESLARFTCAVMGGGGAGGFLARALSLAVSPRDVPGSKSGRNTEIIAGVIGGAVFMAVFGGWLLKGRLMGLAVTIVFMVASPFVGLCAGFLITVIVIRTCRKLPSTKVNKFFRKLQLVSSFFYSVMHGTSDAQKVMGIITLVLVFDGTLTTFEVPLWVVLGCHLCISLGTLLGGWKIVRTMAQKITKLLPYQGFSAETGGGLVLMMNAAFGIPVSTTHVISSSIMGVGATRRLSAVRWGVARNVITAWVLTIPMAALISFLVMMIIRLAGLARPF